MKKLYLILLFLIGSGGWLSTLHAQKCHLLKASIQTSESRCAATGSILINPSGGSGSYKFKVEGPVNTDFTTSPEITGLAAGNYKVIINDMVTNCSLIEENIYVSGDYEDPRFGLKAMDVTCDNGSNGEIHVQSVQYGRPPFTYFIVAPSPSGVGTFNNTGVFSNLSAGDYSIQLRDSCGGIQTRTVTINNYSWKIDSHNLVKFSCDSASGSIRVSDSRGNISTIQGIAGFSYGYMTTAGDTLWSQNPAFRLGVRDIKSVKLFAKDNCGKVKQITATLSYEPSVDKEVEIFNTACAGFSARVTGMSNFSNPEFCLYGENNELLQCNDTGVFTDLQYGMNYCIKVLDECSGTTVSRCFIQQPAPVFIDKEVNISNKQCLTFDAQVAGLNGFTNPYFILFKNESQFITTNTTGIFKNLEYGNYCILSQDGCRDTAVRQCFTVLPPVPRVDSVIVPSYVNCVDFGFIVGGDSLTRPTYCLFDTANVLVACNTTGIFDHIPLGRYCVTVHDDCLDITFTRCFSVGPPVIPNDVSIDITDKTCLGFTASVSTQNFKNGAFCLFGEDSILIKCDSSGIFQGLPYGNYFITSQNFCPDTTVTTPFSASPPIPKVNASPSLSNKTCTTFSATITGQQNLTEPAYFLINSYEEVIDSNDIGRFDHILYGSYCIRIVDRCYDTTINVCFTGSPTPIALSANAVKSCNYGFSRFSISLSGNFPINIKVMDPGYNILHDRNYSNGSAVVDNLPDLENGAHYTILATDNCGNQKSVTLAPQTGYLQHTASVTQKCPGSLWTNGSGNIQATATSNTGALTVRIIKKDFKTLSPILIPNAVSGAVYTFSDLGPGSYIIRYNTNNGCNVYLYDTVEIRPYAYPELNKSTAYQCDVNGFSVGSVVTNGVGPFAYSIIGSIPEAPAIIAGPQNDPVFNINNGHTYSLIRLRALDACGNATLGDASILPLANNGIRISENCFNMPVDLTIDEMYNSTATWYKKDKITDTDSVFVGTGFGYYIPTLMPKDTGIYICHLQVNNGCIQRVFYMNVTGNCYPPLQVNMVLFEGVQEPNKATLNWKINFGNELLDMIIERKSGNEFEFIGALKPEHVKGEKAYLFIDTKPLDQNYYRIKFLHKNGFVSYSRVIRLQANKKPGITVYPNPVMDILNVEMDQTDLKMYEVTLSNSLNQIIKGMKFLNNTGKFTINRTSEMKSGLYLLIMESEDKSKKYTFKVIFK